MYKVVFDPHDMSYVVRIYKDEQIFCNMVGEGSQSYHSPESQQALLAIAQSMVNQLNSTNSTASVAVVDGHYALESWECNQEDENPDYDPDDEDCDESEYIEIDDDRDESKYDDRWSQELSARDPIALLEAIANALERDELYPNDCYWRLKVT